MQKTQLANETKTLLLEMKRRSNEKYQIVAELANTDPAETDRIKELIDRAKTLLKLAS